MPGFKIKDYYLGKSYAFPVERNNNYLDDYLLVTHSTKVILGKGMQCPRGNLRHL